jgi:hypothetical protein
VREHRAGRPYLRGAVAVADLHLLLSTHAARQKVQGVLAADLFCSSPASTVRSHRSQATSHLRQ